MARTWTHALCTVGLMAFVFLVSDAQAYSTYQSAEDAADNCSACHTGFGGPSGSLHGAHTSVVSECTACHTSPGSTPVATKFEPGSPGCSGCHVVDGLVTHHTNANAPPDGMGLVCMSCHPGVSPGPESEIPPYYPGGSAALASVELDPCAEGLDNDGDLFYDQDDPDCAPAVEDCFNGLDDDSDELIDCADPDCDGVTDGACDTGEAGICAAGTRTCSGGFEVCDPDNAPQNEGPPGNSSCQDGLDNDCDGAADSADPDCQADVEANCFDGIDNDLDDLIDCADPNCEGAAGEATTCGVGACADNTGQFECRGGAQVDSCDPFGGAAADDAICDGIDDDCDELTDEDYAANSTTCGVGACAAEGLLECVDGQEVDSCLPGEPGSEGPFGDATCEDGLDNDCDGDTDLDDMECQAAPEVDCFDGVDNDEDGATDCADPDCEGSTNGTCDTGDPGVCAEGTYTCVNGEQICRYDTEPQPEGNMYDNCNDGLDNDCDGFADVDDTACDMMLADVWLKKLIAHDKVTVRVGDDKIRRVFAMARADTKSQDATVTLTVEAPDGVTVTLDPDTVTQQIDPFVATYQDDDSSSSGSSSESDDDGSSEMDDDTPLFKFFPVITCDEPGAFTIVYTAEISAPENRTREGDVATATTIVRCKAKGGGHSRKTRWQRYRFPR